MAAFLLSFLGTQNSGNEIFVHTLALDEGTASFPSQDDVADAALDAITAFLEATNVRSVFPSTTRWTEVKAARILNLTTGTLFAATTRPVPIGTGTGLAGANSALPPQCAEAVSLRGAPRSNGTPTKGRFYLPGISAGSAPGGIIDSSVRGILQVGLSAMFDQLNSDIQDRAPQVWSRKDGVTRTVEAFAVGSVVDTIRTRRNALPEAKTWIDVES